MPGFTTEQVRHDTVAAWAELTATLDRIPEKRWTEKVGKGSWRVVDIVAHLSYWGERLPSDVRACLDDTAVKELGSEVNKRVARERKGWSVHEAREALEAAERAVLRAIDDLPDTHPRLKLAQKLTHHEAVEHVRTHIKQLQDWLDTHSA